MGLRLKFNLVLFGVFVFVMVVLDLMLEWLIIRPVARLSAAADQISTGDFSMREFRDSGKHEVSVPAHPSTACGAASKRRCA